MAIKNIIFDLGGVILNLDFKKTSAAFTKLGVENFDSYFTQFHAHSLFIELETGNVINAGFYDVLRKTANISASNNEIDEAWNAMLLDFPQERIELLKQLKKEYRIFLFSNTNAIHHAAFHQKFYAEFDFNFDELFEKAWYSHLISQRKPNVAAFEYVIKDAGLNAADTLFIDDTLPNVDAAREAGLQAALVLPGKKNVIELLKETL